MTSLTRYTIPLQPNTLTFISGLQASDRIFSCSTCNNEKMLISTRISDDWRQTLAKIMLDATVCVQQRTLNRQWVRERKRQLCFSYRTVNITKLSYKWSCVIPSYLLYYKSFCQSISKVWIESSWVSIVSTTFSNSPSSSWNSSWKFLKASSSGGRTGSGIVGVFPGRRFELPDSIWPATSAWLLERLGPTLVTMRAAPASMLTASQEQWKYRTQLLNWHLQSIETI